MALSGNRVTRYQPTPQEQAQHKKEALAGRVEKQSRVRILEAIRKKLPDALPRPDLEMAVLDYFRRLGHDNHRRLSKVYEWEEKRTKASWGAQNVDYEKIAAAALHLPSGNRDRSQARFTCSLEPSLLAYALTVGSAAGLYIIIRLSYKRYPYLAYKHIHTVFEGEAAMNIGVQRDSRRASSHCTKVSLEFESTSRA